MLALQAFRQIVDRLVGGIINCLRDLFLNTYSVASAFCLLICAHHTELCNINHSFPGLMTQKQETSIQINIKKFQVKPSFQSNDYQLNCVYWKLCLLPVLHQLSFYFFFNFNLYFNFVDVCVLSRFICGPYACSASGSQKRSLHPQGWELQVGSCQVCAGN